MACLIKDSATSDRKLSLNQINKKGQLLPPVSQLQNGKDGAVPTVDWPQALHLSISQLVFYLCFAPLFQLLPHGWESKYHHLYKHILSLTVQGGKGRNPRAGL